MTFFRGIITVVLLAMILTPVIQTAQMKAEISIKTGDIIRNEKSGKTYAVGRVLGNGGFGKVFDAVDKKETRAMKVTSNNDRTKKAAEQEIRILKRIKRSRSKNPGKRFCIEIVDDFVYENQFCIVFEKLGMSVGAFIKKNGYKPFPMSQVKLMAWQLIQAFSFLHEIGITHGDVKPVNILFADDSFSTMTANDLKNAAVKLVDFGLAVTKSDDRTSRTGPRNNRSPEIILRLGWSFPSDVWALACVLIEFYTGGRRLFKINHRDYGSEAKLLLMIEKVLQSRSEPNKLVFPEEMRIGAQQNPKTPNFFTQEGKVNYDKSNITNFDKIYKPLDEYKILKNDKDTDQLFSLLRKMLAVDPNERITMRDALKHKFFRHMRHHRH